MIYENPLKTNPFPAIIHKSLHYYFLSVFVSANIAGAVSCKAFVTAPGVGLCAVNKCHDLQGKLLKINET